MEPTQKLDEDEEPYIREKVQAEEIGILGICGKTYPITMGPNNIGRDENLANICLNVQSISKLHAVINILSKREFMLMDLNSVNKTKVGTKVLQPYIQYPIHNGDIIHFGKVFGIFRLHDNNCSLPCTQAEPIPETPVKHSIHSIATQIIPESPEVSEDDSFFSVSVRNGDRDSNVHKPKLIENDEKFTNIHEMATQLPFVIDKNDNTVNSADTQLIDSQRKGIVDISNRLNRNQTVVMACDNTVKESTQLFENDQVDITKCQGGGPVIETVEHADLKPDNVIDYELESKIIDHITIEPTQISRIEPSPNVNIQKKSSQIVTPVKVSTQACNSKVLENKPKENSESPFKVPSPVKAKKRDKSTMSPVILNSSISEDIEEENYYCLTQEIFDDLNDQQTSKANEVDDLQNNSEIHENISNYLNVFSPDIVPDPNTPVKCRSKSFIDAELPSSQEIKSSVKSLFKEESVVVSSDSDSDTPRSEENTPILFRKTIRSKGTSKINLIQHLPPRRIRKPNKKYIDSKLVSNTNDDEVVDRDIVMENIKRLKSNSNTSISSDEKLSRLQKVKAKETKPQSSKGKEPEVANKKSNDNKVKDTNQTQQNKEREKKNESKRRDDEKKKEQKKRDNERMRDQKRRDDEKKKEQKKRETDKKKEQKRKDTKRAEQNNKDKNKPMDDRSKSEVEDLRRSDRLKKDRRINGSSSSLASTSSDERSRKRTSDDNTEWSNSKRRKADSDRTDNANARPRSLRPLQKHKILFSSYPHDVVIKEMFRDLGCEIVSDVFECTIVICLFLKSTTKLLCAVGMGKPIVGPNWIQACVDTNMIVDPWKYIIRDEIKEKRLNFDLKKTLLGKRNFLKGYNVSCTSRVELPASDLKLIIECSGGVWKEGGPKWLCISTAEDREYWPRYKNMGATVVSPEVIFSGVMGQTLNLSNNIIHALPTLRTNCI